MQKNSGSSMQLALILPMRTRLWPSRVGVYSLFIFNNIFSVLFYFPGLLFPGPEELELPAVPPVSTDTDQEALCQLIDCSPDDLDFLCRQGPMSERGR